MKYNLDRLSGMENAISEGFYDLPFDEQVETVAGVYATQFTPTIFTVRDRTRYRIHS